MQPCEMSHHLIKQQRQPKFLLYVPPKTLVLPDTRKCPSCSAPPARHPPPLQHHLLRHLGLPGGGRGLWEWLAELHHFPLLHGLSRLQQSKFHDKQQARAYPQHVINLWFTCKLTVFKQPCEGTLSHYLSSSCPELCMIFFFTMFFHSKEQSYHSTELLTP